MLELPGAEQAAFNAFLARLDDVLYGDAPVSDRYSVHKIAIALLELVSHTFDDVQRAAFDLAKSSTTSLEAVGLRASIHRGLIDRINRAGGPVSSATGSTYIDRLLIAALDADTELSVTEAEYLALFAIEIGLTVATVESVFQHIVPELGRDERG